MYTGCIWGQDDVSIRDIKKELKSLKEITLRVSTNNDRMLLSYLDKNIKNHDIITIERNFFTLDSLYSVLMNESSLIISYNIKKRKKQIFLTDLASLRENLLTSIMPKKESYSRMKLE